MTQGTSVNKEEPMPIAVVGMGCRLPGGANSPEKLWQLLERKQSARTEVPADRFNIDAFYHADSDKNGSFNTRGGHFLTEDVSAFDAPFFRISPAEARSMDPMQRLLLEVAYEAIESAGISLQQLAGSQTGCYVGCFTHDYDEIAKKDAELLPKYHATGAGQAILSNRLSYFFDLKGPSLSLDTACSSSLIALHLACQSLRAGESTTALVGATNLILNPDIMVGMTNLHMLSPDSISYSFDSRANGYARGEGIAAVILKPLQQAISDGDTIRAIIRGTAINSNGSNSGITLPSKDAQVRLIRSAYQDAACDPALTGYFEAHGTGTAAGDPLEANAIGEAFGPLRPAGEEGKLFVGSVKSNIGHLEGASGLAGLIKVILSLEKGLIAPNIWFEKGNPAIDFDRSRIRVPTEMTSWPSGLRRASVNSFGYGGANGHVILDDAHHYMLSRGIKGKHQTEPHSTLPVAEDISDQQHPRLLHISTQASASVTNMIESFEEFLHLKSPEDESAFIDDLAFTLNDRRTRFDLGRSVVASSIPELITELQQIKAIKKRPTRQPNLGFVFTGQGAQWWAMGRELLRYRRFYQSIVACGKAVKECGASWSVLEELTKDQKSSRINNSEFSQPICSALQIALVDLFTSWDVHPTRVVGHSSGEIAAAYAVGILDLESAMRVAYFRGLLSLNIKPQGFDGSMLAAGLSEEEALGLMKTIDSGLGNICVACVNSPRSVTISGDRPALLEMEKLLASQGFFARQLQVEIAYHSHHMQSIADEYLQKLENLAIKPWSERKPVTMHSSLHSRAIAEGDDLGAKYWVANLVSPVHFSEALTDLCYVNGDRSIDVLVELGPHSALAGPVKQVLASLPPKEPGFLNVQYFSALVRDRKAPKGADTTALSCLASLFDLGYSANLFEANFSGLIEQRSATPSVVVDLPSYSWDHSRQYWAESRLSRDHRFRRSKRSEILGIPSNDWNPSEPKWRNIIRLQEQPWIRSHNIQGAVLYPAAGFLSMAVEAASQLVLNDKNSISACRLEHVSMTQGLIIPDTEDGVEVVVSLRPRKDGLSSSLNGWKEFSISSYTYEHGWTLHCSGSVEAVDEPKKSSKNHLRIKHENRLQDSRARCTSNVPSKDFYKTLAAIGLQYGSHFQGITQVAAGFETMISGIHIAPDLSETQGILESQRRFMHPATMDALFQMMIGASTNGDMESLLEPFIPIFIEHVTINSNTQAEACQSLEAIAQSRLTGAREISGIVSVTSGGEDPRILITMEGVKLRGLGVPVTNTTAKVPSHTATLCWEPDIDLFENEKELNAVLRSSITNSSDGQRMRDLEALAYHYFTVVLNKITKDDIAKMHPYHQKFITFMQEQRHRIKSTTGEQQSGEFEDAQTMIASIRQSLKNPSAGNDYELDMIVRVGEALLPILKQETDPLELMMKDNLLDNYYSAATGVRGSYEQINKYVTMLSHKYPDLDYLEIGAGTGGCTVPVLEALGEANGRAYRRAKSYTFTDVSPSLLQQSQNKFKAWKDIMEYAKLDIERDPLSQPGFQDKKFDVIIAANVLHATYDMSRTMSHVRKLLKPGGRLILLEMTRPVLGIWLIFGCLPGWWNTAEEWRDLGPLLDEDQWERVMVQNKFTKAEANTPNSRDPLEEQTRLIIARAEEEPEVRPSHNDSQSLLVITPQSSSASSLLPQRIMDQLKATTSERLAICSIDQVKDQDLENTIVISLAELDQGFMHCPTEAEFSLVQYLINECEGLVWITRGSIATSASRPELSIVLGMLRSIRAESEGKTLISLDFAADIPLSDDDTSNAILRVLKQSFSSRWPPRFNTSSPDREISERGGTLHIKRAIENTWFNKQIALDTATEPPEPELKQIWQLDRPVHLRSYSKHKPQALAFGGDADTQQQSLPHDHVVVSVHAVGLTLRDASIWKGDSVDSGYLGTECSGIVIKVGDQVSRVKVGDRVAVLHLGSAATSIRVPARSVQPILDRLSFAMASSLPLASITAWYALERLGGIEKGHNILIHGATSIVGQLMVQITQSRGANVFVTAETTDEADFLSHKFGIPDSHIVSEYGGQSFADIVKESTGGHGMHIAFNTKLAKDSSYPLTQILAPFGTLIEICDDVNSKERTRRSAFTTQNFVYASVDAVSILRENQEMAAALFAGAMTFVRENGYVGDPSLLTIKPFSEIEDCMRSLHEDYQEKRFVAEKRENDWAPCIPQTLNEVTFRADGSYLMSGGLGGIGRSMARWMASKGAQNFIFVSRSGVSSPDAVGCIEEIMALGARYEVIKCDISDTERLSTLLETALETMPPVRGVVQGAMVLRDALFSNMSYDSYIQSLTPKVKGSWALHQVTLQQPLEFFLLLSSCASFWGNAGQSNYAAGGAYQVALAAHRRSLGLPGTVVDIGKVSQIGVVAENTGSVHERNLTQLGLVDINEHDLLSILGQAIMNSHPERHANMPNGHLLTGLNSTNNPDGGTDLPFWGRDPVFSHMDFVRSHLRQGTDEDDSSTSAAQKLEPLPQLLQKAESIKDAVGYILSALLAKLSRALLVPLEELDAEKSVMTYGADSLVAVELRNWFKREADATVNVFDILQAPSLAALAATAMKNRS